MVAPEISLKVTVTAGHHEGYGLLTVIHAQGAILDVLAETDDGHVFVVDGLIDGKPGIFLLGRLTEDIHVAVGLAEIAALHDVDTHHAEESPIDEDAGKRYMLVAFAPAPRLIAVVAT